MFFDYQAQHESFSACPSGKLNPRQRPSSLTTSLLNPTYDCSHHVPISSASDLQQVNPGLLLFHDCTRPQHHLGRGPSPSAFAPIPVFNPLASLFRPLGPLNPHKPSVSSSSLSVATLVAKFEVKGSSPLSAATTVSNLEVRGSSPLMVAIPLSKFADQGSSPWSVATPLSTHKIGGSSPRSVTSVLSNLEVQSLSPHRSLPLCPIPRLRLRVLGRSAPLGPTLGFRVRVPGWSPPPCPC